MSAAPCAPSPTYRSPPFRRGVRACAFVLGASIALSIVGESTARAQDAYGCIDRLPDAAVKQRLRYVEGELARARRVEMPWWIGWMAFNTVSLGIAYVGFFRASTPVARDTWLVNIVGSSFFVIPEAIVPMVGLYSRRRLARVPARTPAERRIKLRTATELLQRSALITSSQRGPAAHIGGWGYGAASTAYIAIKDHDQPGNRDLALALQFSTTVVVAEITILSVPRRAERAWEDYRYFACSDPWMGGPEPLPEELQDALPPRPHETARAPRTPPFFVGIGLGSVAISGRF